NVLRQQPLDRRFGTAEMDVEIADARLRFADDARDDRGAAAGNRLERYAVALRKGLFERFSELRIWGNGRDERAFFSRGLDGSFPVGGFAALGRRRRRSDRQRGENDQDGLRCRILHAHFFNAAANFSSTFSFSSLLAPETGGKSFIHSNGRQASISA